MFQNDWIEIGKLSLFGQITFVADILDLAFYSFHPGPPTPGLMSVLPLTFIVFLSQAQWWHLWCQALTSLFIYLFCPPLPLFVVLRLNPGSCSCSSPNFGILSRVEGRNGKGRLWCTLHGNLKREILNNFFLISYFLRNHSHIYLLTPLGVEWYFKKGKNVNLKRST